MYHIELPDKPPRVHPPVQAVDQDFRAGPAVTAGLMVIQGDVQVGAQGVQARPSTQTFLPNLYAVLMICCTLSTLEAKVAMIMREFL